jgi:peptidoglycan/LPS O-acetylase OafA/YrhL
VSQTWSIGVEEQFYYFWPWVVRNNHKKLLTAMVLLLIFFFVIRTATVLYMPITGIWLYLHEFIKSLRITCMILGAIGAYFAYFHTKSQFVAFIFSKGFQLVLYATVIISFSLGMYIAGINQEIYSVLFALVIMNLAKNPKSILSLENPVFDFLGKISYGLYMYHTIAVVIGVKIAMMVGNNSNWISYPITFILTILVSWLSYSYIEKPFLKIKNRFTTVKSGKL